MKVFICLEFYGVDCNDENGDAIVESITQACEGMQKAWGATGCWVDDAINDGEFMIQKFYGADEGWQNVRDDGMLFSSRQEALEWWFEEEFLDGIDITTLSLPNDIRIVEIKGV